MRKISRFALLVITGFAIYGATAVEFQSPLKEVRYQEAAARLEPLPDFQLSREIDGRNAVFAKLADE